MVGVENNENVRKTLQEIKNIYRINPKLITCDFSPNIIGPICDVFGEDKLQIDGFHVMQELNRGIRTHLLLFREKSFVNEIQDLKKMRNWISNMQKGYKNTGIFTFDINELKKRVNIVNKSVKTGLSLIVDLIPILNTLKLAEFDTYLVNMINELEQSNQEQIIEYTKQVKKLLPKNKTSNKRRNTICYDILSKIKSFLLKYRSKLELESKQFHKDYWVLFCQPEKMNEDKNKLLSSFLGKYPELHEFRVMTLSIGEIYRQNISEVNGNQIDILEIKPYYADKLKTAINTLKKFKTAIIRFSTVFKNDSKLAKASRTSMEYMNKFFKSPFKKGFNRTSLKVIQNKLRLQMNCEVHFSF